MGELDKLHEFFGAESERRRQEDVNFFKKNPPRIEYRVEETIYGIFKINREFYYAQKYSNGYHVHSLVKLETEFLEALRQVMKWN